MSWLLQTYAESLPIIAVLCVFYLAALLFLYVVATLVNVVASVPPARLVRVASKWLVFAVLCAACAWLIFA